MHQGVAVLMHVGSVLDVLGLEAEVSEALDFLPAALAEAAGQLQPRSASCRISRAWLTSRVRIAASVSWVAACFSSP